MSNNIHNNSIQIINISNEEHDNLNLTAEVTDEDKEIKIIEISDLRTDTGSPDHLSDVRAFSNDYIPALILDQLERFNIDIESLIEINMKTYKVLAAERTALQGRELLDHIVRAKQSLDTIFDDRPPISEVLARNSLAKLDGKEGSQIPGLNVVCVGPSRMGKSSFINIMCMQEIAERGSGPMSVTAGVARYSCFYKTMNINWIDTPGFLNRESDSIRQNWIKITHNITKLTHANVLLIFTDYEKLDSRFMDIIKSLQRTMRKDALDSCLFILTGNIQGKTNEVINNFRIASLSEGCDLRNVRDTNFVLFPQYLYLRFQSQNFMDRIKDQTMLRWLKSILLRLSEFPTDQLFYYNWVCLGSDYQNKDSVIARNHWSCVVQ